MKKLIKQIICSFIAIVAVMGLTTGNAYAQLTLSNDIGNQVIVAIDNEEEANNTEVGRDCSSVVCSPGVQYYPNPSACDSFCQCSNGVPYYQPCPAGLEFNSKLNVCDWPEDAGCSTSGES